MTLWIALLVMMVAAIALLVVPVYRRSGQLDGVIVLSCAVVVLLSAGVYYRIGTPDYSNAEPGQVDVAAMVTSLAQRLQENPDDLAGWKMLGRSYFSMRNFAGAIAALEKAVELESAQNGQTLTDLGEAVLYADQSALTGRAGQLFEQALSMQPHNPKALFYGGMAAVERGDKELGATRWEALLATSPPPNIQEILRQQIAELRGNAAPAAGSSVSSDISVAVNVELGDAVVEAALPDSTVFIIARDPAQPSPPIAAVRRRLSELPGTITISDADAMLPGRVPSSFAQIEFLARISVTGEPIAASGDWYGQKIIDTSNVQSVDIVIDTLVP